MELTTEYKLFKMLNTEISFDIDVSNMSCGTNSAVYFSEMDKTGNAGPTNKTGTAYGTGYCDGQRARDLKWVNGKGNSDGWIPNRADPYDNSGTTRLLTQVCMYVQEKMSVAHRTAIALLAQLITMAATSLHTGWWS